MQYGLSVQGRGAADPETRNLTSPTGKKVIVACPHGFCAGVVRAVASAEAVLARHGRPVYCFNEIVHNRMVVDELAAKGMVFVTTPEEIPPDSVVLFSAHGVSPETRQAVRARARGVVDATCPFVTKVHAEVRRYVSGGLTVLMIGKPHHEEVIGVVGESPENVIVVADVPAAEAVRMPEESNVAVVMQTTLSVDDAQRVLDVLRRRFPALVTPVRSDICYATQNRQQAVRELARRVDYVVVLGSHNSSNSNRLAEVARDEGRPAMLVNSIEELDQLDLSDVRTLGLKAGASTPQLFVDTITAYLRDQGFDDVDILTTAEEHQEFALPRELDEE